MSPAPHKFVNFFVLEQIGNESSYGFRTIMRYFPGREFVSLSGRRPTFAWQFAFAGTIVLLLSMILIGLWVTSKIESAAVRNMASGTALYVSGIVSPLTQELATNSSLSDDARGKFSTHSTKCL